jgi:hypothetical protein
MQLTVTSYFYTRAAHFTNNGNYSEAKKDIAECLNLSILYQSEYYYDRCLNISNYITGREKSQFGNFSDRMVWVLNDSTQEQTPWDIRLDLTKDFDKFTTTLENLEIKPLNKNDMGVGLSFNDDRNESNGNVSENGKIDHLLLFVNSLEQSYSTNSTIQLDKKRVSICFDSPSFSCVALSQNSPVSSEIVKYYSGYSYGVEKVYGPFELTFFNGLKSLDNLSNYPFISYESEVLLFFPSKNQIIKNIKICGNDEMKIQGAKIQLINPSSFNVSSGSFNFSSVEIVDYENVNKTIDILSYDGNCFYYHFPSNNEGRQISGYWLYSIKSQYGIDKTNLYNYLILFFISSVGLIFLPLFLFLINKYYHLFKSEEIGIALVNIFISGGTIVVLVEKSESLRNASPSLVSFGNIIIFATWVLTIIIPILLLFVLHNLIKSSKKELMYFPYQKPIRADFKKKQNRKTLK